MSRKATDRVSSVVVSRAPATGGTSVRFAPDASMKPTDKGAIGEAEVRADFTRRGWIVCDPNRDDSPYDMVVDNGELHRVQVKYASLDDDGAIRVSIQRSNPNANGSVEKDYTSDEVDVYAVYCPETDNVYWIPFEEAPRTNMHLRVGDRTEDKRIRWAEDYAL